VKQTRLQLLQLFNPFSGVLQGSRITRQPILNNIITKDKISPIATAYFQFYPAPNQPGDGRWAQ